MNAQKLDMNANSAEVEKSDREKVVSAEREENWRQKSPEVTSPSVFKGSYFDRVAQRKKNWEYFEINHPKAISDQVSML